MVHVFKGSKRIVLLVAMGALLSAFSHFAIKSRGEELQSNPILRMPTFISNIQDTLKPEAIDKVEEYTLLNVLFSPLVLFDNSGRIEANLATRFYWEDQTTLVFSFDRHLTTKDGYEIGAMDALISLKRMILLNRNMHGNLRDRIEIPDTFRSLGDPLENIFVRDGKLYIKTKKKDFFVLHILASADFVIIPHRSINNKTLQIIDFANTSGPYYLFRENEAEVVLKQNKGHFRISKNNASEVNLKKYLPKDSKVVVSDFENGLLDHIPTVAPLSTGQYLNLAKHPGTVLHETRDIMLFFGLFTHKARIRLKPSVRLKIARAIQDVIQEAIPNFSDRAVITSQFFHEDGVGGISSDILLKLKADFVDHEIEVAATTEDSLTIEASPGFISVYKPILEKKFKNMIFLPINRVGGTAEGSQADLIFTSVDVGLKEDFTGISFAAEWGVFPFSAMEKRSWLEALSSESDSRVRAQMIEDLHIKALFEDTTIVPLYRLPVFALTRNRWKMDLPDLWVTERIWQISYE
jgi:hypothetical protein